VYSTIDVVFHIMIENVLFVIN